MGRKAHAEAIRSHGLRITGRTELVAHPGILERVAQAKSPDVIIVTVKAYDTGEAVQALKPFARTSTYLSLQNGLGNEELLAENVDMVLGGTTGHGVTFIAPGQVYHAGIGETFIGPFKGTGLKDAGEVAEAFTACGMAATATEDIRRELWLKAMVNACINPLTAILRAKNGRLLESEPLQLVAREVVAEGIRVAALQGIHLDEEEVLRRVWSTAKATAENRSSMLQDLERGRRTEIGAINGAIVEMGRAGGIRCRANSLLTLLVKAAEEVSRSR